MTMYIKTGDTVRVITGAEKGKEGKVIQTFPKKSLVVVDGVHKSTRHMKARGGQGGQKISFFAPLRAENVKKIV